MNCHLCAREHRTRPATDGDLCDEHRRSEDARERLRAARRAHDDHPTPETESAYARAQMRLDFVLWGAS